MAKSGIYPIKGWGCTKCGAEMIGVSEIKAQEHYNVPIDKPFPIGFTFKHAVFIYRIFGKGNLDQSIKDLDSTHGWIQPYEFCSGRSINDGFLSGLNYLNSKVLKRDFLSGHAQILDFEDLGKIKKANPGKRIIENTSVLEKLAQSKEKTKSHTT